MQERRKVERRKWGKRVSYPFIDSNGNLVTQNRRRLIDRREENLSNKPDTANVKRCALNTSYEVVEEAVPVAPTSAPQPEPKNGAEIEVPTLASRKLIVRCNGKEIEVSKKSISCRLGRDPNCDITIPGKYSSRDHAELIWHENKLILCDHSFNGTFIIFKNGIKKRVLNKEQRLEDDGVISLGQPIKTNEDGLIHFEIRND